MYIVLKSLGYSALSSDVLVTMRLVFFSWAELEIRKDSDCFEAPC